jgi:hypothetical protein
MSKFEIHVFYAEFSFPVPRNNVFSNYRFCSTESEYLKNQGDRNPYSCAGRTAAAGPLTGIIAYLDGLPPFGDLRRAPRKVCPDQERHVAKGRGLQEARARELEARLPGILDIILKGES